METLLIMIPLVYDNENNINISWDIAHRDPFCMSITDKISWDFSGPSSVWL